MQIHDTTIPVRNGIAVLNGYGVRVAVARRHLVLSDGIGRQRRNCSFAKGISRIRRLLIIAQTGSVSLEAIRWLRDAKSVLVQLDYDGSLIAESVEGLDDARLRRAQALAFHSALRLRIAHRLLAAKIEGQLAVANSFGLAAPIEASLSDVRQADTLGVVLRGEAQAAEAYWDAWADIPVQFARRDCVPDHWRHFRERGSPLTQRPRNAINPANAMLNYLYALLEVETRIALRARGLDPGLGFFHADTANRASLAADVMEPVRPHVDAYLLSLLRGRTFSARDFVEMRDGTCRMAASLTRELADTMPAWARLVAPHAERLARDLLAFAKSNHTESPSLQRFVARPGARIKIRSKEIAAPERPKATPSIPTSRFHNACRQCGAKLAVRKRVYCDNCLPGELQRIQRETAETFQAAGPVKIAAMRASGADPTNTLAARKRRVATAKQQRRAIAAWHDDGSTRGVDFDRDVLPGLQGVPVREIANAMGASISHASKVRSGHVKPHKRHWNILRSLRPQSA